MAVIKKLYFANGVAVTGVADLTSESSTVKVNEYVDDAAYVTANGTAQGGDLYINTTLRALRLFTGSAWRTVVMSSDDADPTKTFLVDLDGATTGTSATLDFNQTSSRVYSFPDYAGTVSLNTGTETNPIIFAGATGNTDIGNASGTVRVLGNFEVQGTQTIFNTETVEVEDTNILVNNGGSDATAQGAGLTVERTGTSGSMVYDSAEETKWKAGNTGSEVGLVDKSTAQTLTNKSISGSTNTITNLDLTSTTSGILPTTKGGTGVNGSATYPSSGIVASVPSSGVVKSNGSVLSSSNVDLTSEVTGTLPVANGGTGQTTANAALNALLPSQAGNSGKVLSTNGTDTSWAAGGAGGGSGEINTILNPNNADSGWAASGAGVTVATTSTSSDLPLEGVSATAIKITPVSGTDFARYRFTMPAALKNRKLKFEWHQRPLSGYASGDLKAEVYKNSASNYGGSYSEFALSTDVSGTTSIPNQSGKFTTAFDADDGDYYEVRFVRVAGTTALNIVNVIVGPGIQPQGAVISDPVAYTPTYSGMGTVTNSSVFYSRNGSKMILWGTFKTGSPAASLASFTLPSGLSINTNYHTEGRTSFGDLLLNDNSAGLVSAGSAYAVRSNTNNQAIFVGITKGSIASNNTMVAENGNAIFTTNSTITIQNLEIEIAEWAGSGTLNLLSDNEIQTNVRVQATGTSVGSTASVTEVTAVYSTEVKDTHNAYNPSTGVFTAPVTGDYSVDARFGWDGSSTSYIAMAIRKNATNVKYVEFIGGNYAAISGVVSCVAGDTISIRTFYSSGTSPRTPVNTASTQTLDIFRIADYSAGEAVGFGMTSSEASGLSPAMGDRKTGNLTVGTFSAGTVSATLYSRELAYRTPDGQWRVKFNIKFSATSVTATNAGSFVISGLTAKNDTNGEQGLNVCIQGEQVGFSAYISPNTGTVTVATANNMTNGSYHVWGDIDVESKPSWA